jgi:serine/threonine-protein phosphatase PGAM5
MMHRAFRTTLHTSMAACAALAATATLASSEGAIENKNIVRNVTKENGNMNSSSKRTTTWDYNWDRLHSNEQTTSTTSTRVIHLVRHGQFNQKGKDDAKHTLTDLGKRQASLAGKRLRDIIPKGTTPKRIISSTMTRAEETAQIIRDEYFKEIETIEKTDLLREGGPTRPEPDTWTPYGGPSEAEYWKDGARIEAGFRWLFHRPKAKKQSASKDKENEPIPNAKEEKKSETKKTKNAAEEEKVTAPKAVKKAAAKPASPPPAAQEETHEIVVCHGNVIRYSLLRLLQLPPEAWLRFSLYNGSITRVEIRSDGLCSVRCVSDAGFMKPSEISFN